jgi:hypothetical protein
LSTFVGAGALFSGMRPEPGKSRSFRREPAQRWTDPSKPKSRYFSIIFGTVAFASSVNAPTTL